MIVGPDSDDRWVTSQRDFEYTNFGEKRKPLLPTPGILAIVPPPRKLNRKIIGIVYE